MASLIATLLNYQPVPIARIPKPTRKTIKERGKEKSFAVAMKIKSILRDGEMNTVNLCHALGWGKVCSSNLKRIAKNYPQLRVDHKEIIGSSVHLFWVWVEE